MLSYSAHVRSSLSRLLPGPDFFAAVGVLTLVAALAGALLPAVFAARREPLKELRTP